MFNPLGTFNVNADIDQPALESAYGFLQELPGALGIKLNRLYLHWAVEAFGCLDGSYNAEVDLENGKWVIKITHDPRTNGVGDPNTMASHTWHRNSYAFGLAITGMDGATEHNFGQDGVQMHELEFLCAAAAAVCVKYGIDSQGIVTDGQVHLDNNNRPVNTRGEHNILTHGECAVIDAYPTERWDLGSFISLPDGVEDTPELRSECGNALRARIHLYALALKEYHAQSNQTSN